MLNRHHVPSLNELLGWLERAFAQHIEVEARSGRTAVMRLGGKELSLRDVREPPQLLTQELCSKLAEVAAFGLTTALTDESVAGTRLRMQLVTALAAIEATTGSNRERPHSDDGDALLTTAEAAAQLGMSRPYVSMLCDQGKLGEVSRSEGGHRRIRQSAVDEYKKCHLGEASGHAPVAKG